jgi:hypothetical protein
VAAAEAGASIESVFSALMHATTILQTAQPSMTLTEWKTAMLAAGHKKRPQDEVLKILRGTLAWPTGELAGRKMAKVEKGPRRDGSQTMVWVGTALMLAPMSTGGGKAEPDDDDEVPF